MKIALNKELCSGCSACAQICSAMREGDGIGEPGAIDISTISTEDLQFRNRRAKINELHAARLAASSPLTPPRQCWT